MIAEAQRPGYPWRVFFCLFTAATLSVVALLPYLGVLLSRQLAAHPLPLPLSLIATLQGALNFTVAAGLGLLLGGQVGLGAPLLENLLYGRPVRGAARPLRIGAVVGTALGAITFLMAMSPAGDPLRRMAPVRESLIPVWKRFLACFYGGIGEEILMRLFLLSLLLWLATKIFRTTPRNRALFWSANLAAAILFGVGHLPIAASLTTLTAPTIVLIIGLNAFVGLGFGYLYWAYCLEAAMVAHFCADIILHVIGPAVVRG